ncbi:hypothetical protein EDD86DRAFT_66672 [Gorgonomyces haynaldii]|nr:hypothetical protein EDD86DRAFT_66672 [Gorgonomyces haynaldii]
MYGRDYFRFLPRTARTNSDYQKLVTSKFFEHFPCMRDHQRIHEIAGIQQRCRGNLTITTSSLVRVSKKAPELCALMLGGQKLVDDHFVPLLEEFESFLPSTFSMDRVAVTSLDALSSVLTNCKKLVCLDLYGCDWVTMDHLEMICEKAQQLSILNVVGCSQLPTALAKLYYFDSCSELKSHLKFLRSRPGVEPPMALDGLVHIILDEFVNVNEVL